MSTCNYQFKYGDRKGTTCNRELRKSGSSKCWQHKNKKKTDLIEDSKIELIVEPNVDFIQLENTPVSKNKSN